MRHLGAETQENRRRIDDESMNVGSYNDNSHIDTSRLLRRMSEMRENKLDVSQSQIPLLQNSQNYRENKQFHNKNDKTENEYYINNSNLNQGVFRPYMSNNKSHVEYNESSRDQQSTVRDPRVLNSEPTENSEVLRRKDQEKFIKDFNQRNHVEEKQKSSQTKIDYNKLALNAQHERMYPQNYQFDIKNIQKLLNEREMDGSSKLSQNHNVEFEHLSSPQNSTSR